MFKAPTLIYSYNFAILYHIFSMASAKIPLCQFIILCDKLKGMRLSQPW